MGDIQLRVLESRIGVATIDMVDRPFNVFSEQLMDELEALIETATADLRALIITSGKRSFVAGADLVMIKDFARMRFDADREEMRARYSRLGQLFRRIERSPIPVVAAINGLALGGGLELAMACHARVCIQTESPILGLPEIKLGLLPGAGGTQRLPRLVGVERGMQMLLSGNPVTSADSIEMGLVDRLAPPDELLNEAVKLAAEMPAGARWDRPSWMPDANDLARVDNHNWHQYCLEQGGWAERQYAYYPAVDAIIKCVSEGFSLPIDDGCDAEWDIFVDLMSDPVAANMVLTCFLNKGLTEKEGSAAIRERIRGLMGDGMQKVDLPRERFETALRAVDGSALWVAAGREQSLAESLTSDEDRIAGLNLLCELASLVIGQCDHAYETIDALSVLELGWPAWTGGPVAFLAMLQRGEIRNWDPPPALLQAVMAIDHPLKIKASYNAAVR